MGIIFGAFALVILLGGAWLFYRAKRTLGEFSRAMFGTERLADGVRKQREELSATPKSVAGMTRIFLPQIQKDFPEFNWLEFKAKSENLLTASLKAISDQDLSCLEGASEELKRQIGLHISDLKSQMLREVYQDVKVHQTEIARYKKEAGTCVIVLQSSIEYYHYTEEGDQIVAGSREYMEQARYNTELQYVQDVSQAVGTGSAKGVVCPQCGAPITKLGSKFCEYCGTAVTVINIHVWSLNKIYEA